MAEGDEGELPCVDHVPLNEGAVGKRAIRKYVSPIEKGKSILTNLLGPETDIMGKICHFKVEHLYISVVLWPRTIMEYATSTLFG